MCRQLSIMPLDEGCRLLTNAVWTFDRNSVPTLASQHLWVRLPCMMKVAGFRWQACDAIEKIRIDTSEDDGMHWEVIREVEPVQTGESEATWQPKAVDNIRFTVIDPAIPAFPVHGSYFTQISLLYDRDGGESRGSRTPVHDIRFKEIEEKSIAVFEPFAGSSRLQIFNQLGLCHQPPETDRVFIRAIGHDVEYSTPNFSMNFSTQFPLIKSMGWDTLYQGREKDNLLSVSNTQGAFPVVAAGGNRISAENCGCSLRISGREVIYQGIRMLPQMKQDLLFRVHEHGFTLKIRTECRETFRTNETASIRIPFDLYKTVTSILAMPDTTGPSGLVCLPLVINAPNYGTMRVTVGEKRGGEVYARISPFRVHAELWLDIIAGAVPLDNGLFEMPQGISEVELLFELTKIFPFGNRDRSDLYSWWEMPPFYSFADRENILGALPNAWLNGLSFRPEIGRFANNSVADSAAGCAIYYADIAAYTPELAPGLSPLELIRFAAEQLLYEPKNMLYSNARMFPSAVTSTVDCAWLYIAASGNWEWAEKIKHAVRENIQILFELEYRDTGLIAAKTSGIPQENVFMTESWLDSIKSGHLESYTNAHAYRSYIRASEILVRVGEVKIAEMLKDKADRLKSRFMDVFYDPGKEQIMQWVDINGRQYGFDSHMHLGAAVALGLVPLETSRRLLAGYLERLRKANFNRYEYGLPILLEPVGQMYYNGWMGKGVEMDGSDQVGVYMNGSITHHQCYYLLQALYRSGMRSEANTLFMKMTPPARKGGMCGALHSGTDWRKPDGEAAGYEGLLAEQYHFLLAAITGYLGLELTIDGLEAKGLQTERIKRLKPDFARVRKASAPKEEGS